MAECDHSWRFDGDDPYVICVYCDEMQDALTGRVIRHGSTPRDFGDVDDENDYTAAQRAEREAEQKAKAEKEGEDE